MTNIMYTIFMLISFLAFTNCIEINLPLSEADKKKYNTEYFYIDLSCDDRLYSIGCSNECIFGIDGNVIHRVSYNGYILFDDTKQQPENFNRVINYSSHDGRTSIAIHPEGKNREYEALFYIANGTVYNLMKAKELITGYSGLIKGHTPGAFLTSVFFKIPSLSAFTTDSASFRATSPTVPTTDFEIPIDIISDDINIIFKRKILRKADLYEQNSSMFEIDDESTTSTAILKPESTSSSTIIIDDDSDSTFN